MGRTNRNAVKALYLAGGDRQHLTQRQVRKRVGLDAYTVHLSQLVRAGLADRKMVPGQEGRYRLTEQGVNMATEEVDGEGWQSVAQIAEHVGVSRYTVYGWIRKGAIESRSYYVGGRKRLQARISPVMLIPRDDTDTDTDTDAATHDQPDAVTKAVAVNDAPDMDEYRNRIDELAMMLDRMQSESRAAAAMRTRIAAMAVAVVVGTVLVYAGAA